MIWLLSWPAQAETVETRLSRLEAVLVEQNQTTTTTASASNSAWPTWLQQVTPYGLVELEAYQQRPEHGSTESDFVLATVELGVTVLVNDMVDVVVGLLYEEGTDLELDIATIRIMDREQGGWFTTAGKYCLPFGVFATHMISDPLTLELGEICDTALAVGWDRDGWSASTYLFRGDDNDSDQQLDNWGIHLAQTGRYNNWNWQIAGSYLNDFATSETVRETLTTYFDDAISRQRVPGWGLATELNYTSITINAEYLAASKRYHPAAWYDGDHDSAQPQVWTVELGYQFALFGRNSVVAIGYQETDEAVALPQHRWLASWSTEIFAHTALGLELARDQDYGYRDGGSNETTDHITAQLAVEF
jgi:hypothetical protein